MRTRKIRVLSVDDHPLVREGIESMISDQPDLELVAAVGTGEEGLALIPTLRPDVVLIDLRLPGLSGFEVTRTIRSSPSGPHVIVLTMYERDEEIARALAAGAAAYLLKDVSCDDLAQTIRKVCAGEHPALSEELRKHLEGREDHTPLTPRELEVIRLIAGGMRNNEIAATLGIGKETVKMHVHNVLTKLHASNRSGALLTAIRHGIIQVD